MRWQNNYHLVNYGVNRVKVHGFPEINYLSRRTLFLFRTGNVCGKNSFPQKNIFMCHLF